MATYQRVQSESPACKDKQTVKKISSLDWKNNTMPRFFHEKHAFAVIICPEDDENVLGEGQ